VVAEAGLRAVHEGIAADGELAAALNGGLIKVVTLAAAAPRVEALAPAGGAAPGSSFRRDMPCFPRAGCRACANSPNATAWPTRRSPMNCSIRPAVFSAGLSAGDATAAIGRGRALRTLHHATCGGRFGSPAIRVLHAGR